MHSVGTGVLVDDGGAVVGMQALSKANKITMSKTWALDFCSECMFDHSFVSVKG